ncbi:PASTA domain-containing protein [Clostridium grantii]|uniref:PASTA domain, binds beta-lactams n=1 Tax=Clostridium grantii DSM 8605 TaxID=1121316 RepID=A0A1M5WCC0_9CLOT|nr:PASTA domain-containing protein [Clostridium grantii]SHH85155.1 PASTA domain, binds beta-lactams [Clostridium grantii DSM 8605]
MSESKSFLDSIALENTKPESFSEEKFEKFNDVNKKKKLIITGSMLAIIIAAAFLITYITGRVKIPDMVGWNINDAYNWAQSNKITLAIKDEYNFDVDEDLVISQDLEVDKNVDKNSTLTLLVSLGADPNESIKFPDIESMTSSEIQTWIDENKLTGAKIETEYSDIIPADNIISYEFLDGTEESFLRKNRVTIYVSDGPEELSETVVIPDFANAKIAEVIQWGSENDIAINIEEVFDEYTSAGLVVTQSVSSESEMLREDSLTVEISKGKAVQVTNFTSMSKTEAEAWAKQNNITLITIESYNNSSSKGKIYSQSISSGTSIEEGDSIKIYYSLGKVSIDNFIGKSKLDILSWRDNVNVNSANITVSINEAYGEKGSAGKIISQSIKDEFVSTGTAISITVSKGMKLVMPNLSGKTQDEVTKLASEMGLKVIFDYKNSELVDANDSNSEPKFAKDYVISQSIASNTIITDNDTITVVISMGK